jgi:hypothetical protein
VKIKMENLKLLFLYMKLTRTYRECARQVHLGPSKVCNGYGSAKEELEVLRRMEKQNLVDFVFPHPTPKVFDDFEEACFSPTFSFIKDNPFYSHKDFMKDINQIVTLNRYSSCPEHCDCARKYPYADKLDIQTAIIWQIGRHLHTIADNYHADLRNNINTAVWKLHERLKPLREKLDFIYHVLILHNDYNKLITRIVAIRQIVKLVLFLIPLQRYAWNPLRLNTDAGCKVALINGAVDNLARLPAMRKRNKPFLKEE